MSTEKQVKSKRVHELILAKRYYREVYEATLHSMGFTQEDILRFRLQDQELTLLWQTFWKQLPSTILVRRAPFCALCSLCGFGYPNDKECGDEHVSD